MRLDELAKKEYKNSVEKQQERDRIRHEEAFKNTRDLFAQAIESKLGYIVNGLNIKVEYKNTRYVATVDLDDCVLSNYTRDLFSEDEKSPRNDYMSIYLISYKGYYQSSKYPITSIVHLGSVLENIEKDIADEFEDLLI